MRCNAQACVIHQTMRCNAQACAIGKKFHAAGSYFLSRAGAARPRCTPGGGRIALEEGRAPDWMGLPDVARLPLDGSIGSTRLASKNGSQKQN